jgi:hypothetical protein
MADDANEVGNMYDPEKCRNFDVVGVVDRLDRTLYELCTSESAVTNDFNAYDRNRYTTMMSEINQYIITVQEQERLDLPHSYPAQYSYVFYTKDAVHPQTGEPIDWQRIKNSFVRDLARLVANALVQWSRSESADASNKFIPADVERWELIYARSEAMVEKYADDVLPGDKPESSDYELGRRGIPTGIES